MLIILASCSHRLDKVPIKSVAKAPPMRALSFHQPLETHEEEGLFHQPLSCEQLWRAVWHSYGALW